LLPKNKEIATRKRDKDTKRKYGEAKTKRLLGHSLRAFPGDGPVQGVGVVELPPVGHLRVAFVADLD
jgi:hypothetical protein